MGLLEVLTIVFVVLKLLGVIAWSWWLVLLPLIISVSIYVIMVAVVVTVNYYAYRKIKRELDEMEND